jgi:adenosylmethionine-8-amino-7-oxononanoate aminotransferase
MIEPQLEPVKHTACAVIVEPIVQGAGGMLCYSADFLRRLANWSKANGIYFIADEIMTGLGRTGKWLASHHADIEPDMICLSKGLTSGTLPLSCVLIDHAIYQLFYHDYRQGKSFLHSHTYGGNALGVSAALATIKVMHAMGIHHQAEELGQMMREYFINIAQESGVIENVRSMGAIVAGDLVTHKIARPGYRIAQEAIKQGALLRPMGKVLYWLPPLTTDAKTIEKLAEITLNSIKAVYYTHST